MESFSSSRPHQSREEEDGHGDQRQEGDEHLRDHNSIETTHWDGSALGARALVLVPGPIEALCNPHQKTAHRSQPQCHPQDDVELRRKAVFSIASLLG
jgi:hypothetical protein